MRVTIICPNNKVDEARQNASSKFGEGLLKTPLSSNGKMPATHWMCVLFTTEDGYQDLLTMRKNCHIGQISPKILLEEMNLKVIEQK